MFLLEKYCNKILFLQSGNLKYYGPLKSFLNENTFKEKYIIRVATPLKNNLIYSENLFKISEHNQGKDPFVFSIELVNNTSLGG